MSGIRLFCFPYAGGSSGTFARWRQKLSPGIQTELVQLPGRGMRFAEPPFASCDLLVETLATDFFPKLSTPFAFFGHSMGALIAFELARYLRSHHKRSPQYLFLSGCSAAHVFEISPKIHELPEDKFIEELRRLDGTPAEVFDNPELLKILLPGLRADFTICETYRYKDSEPLDCPITAFAGDDDREIKVADVRAWQLQTTGSFSFHVFSGGHFFLHEKWEEMVHRVNKTLEPFTR